MPDSSAHSRHPALLPSLAAALILGAASSIVAAAVEGVADTPAKPYAVFVAYPGEVDAQLGAHLHNAAGALGTALADRPEWFRLTESRDEANIRVTVFDAQAATGELRFVGGPAGFTANRVFASRGRDVFSFDAIVRVNGKRKQVNGSGTGATGMDSLKDAAADFVRKLEEFTEESYPAPR